MKWRFIFFYTIINQIQQQESFVFIISEKQFYKGRILLSMDLLKKPEGFTNPQRVYMSPVQMKPTSKVQSSRKDYSLLDVTIKSFLKERLYGKFQNFEKNNHQKKHHLSRQRDQSIQSEQPLSARLQNRLSIYHAHESKRKSQDFRKRRHNNSALSNFEHQRYDAKNKSSLEQYKRQEKSKFRYFKSSVKNADQVTSKKQQNSQSGNDGDHNFEFKGQNYFIEIKNLQKSQLNFGPSFISAIQTEQISLISKGNQFGKGNLKPSFPLRRSIIREDYTKNIKALFKKELEPRVSINDQFWNKVSATKLKKKDLQKGIIPFKNLDDHYDNYDELNTPHSQSLEKQVSSSFKKGGKGSHRQSHGFHLNNQKLLSKDYFLSFIQDEILSIPKLTECIFLFFEISAKLHDKMTRCEFESVFTKLYNANDRLWSVAVFTFLDQGKDSQIGSSDIFKFYNYLEDLQQKVKSEQKRLISSKDFIKVERQPKRQKTNASKTSNLTDRKIGNSDLKLFRIKSGQKETQKSDQSHQENICQESGQQLSAVANNLMNIYEAKQFINKLNNKNLALTSEIEKDTRNQQQGLGKNKLRFQNSKQFYLEEALLNKVDLKSSDLTFLIYESDKSSQTGQKKKVVELNPLKLDYKLTSSYIQTFTATDHNDETRNNREYIETLKAHLKEKKEIRNAQENILQKQSLYTLSYQEFKDKCLHLPIKEIFFKILHMQVKMESK